MGTQVSTVDDDMWVVRPRPLRGPAHDRRRSGRHGDALPAAGGRRWPTGGSPSTATRRPATARWRRCCTRSADIGRTAGGGRRRRPAADRRTASGGSAAVRSPSTPRRRASSSRGCCSPRPASTAAWWSATSGPPVPSAPHLRMTVQMLRAAGAAVDDSRSGRVVGRAGPAGRPGLADRARPVRRRAVPGRRDGDRRRGDRAGLAPRHHPAGRPAARTAHRDGRARSPSAPAG